MHLLSNCSCLWPLWSGIMVLSLTTLDSKISRRGKRLASMPLSSTQGTYKIGCRDSSDWRISLISQNLQIVDRGFEPRGVTGISVLQILQTCELLTCLFQITLFQRVLNGLDSTFPRWSP